MPLKDAAKGLFLVGASLNTKHIREDDVAGVKLVEEHFNTVTPENVMKWSQVHPKPGEYTFELSDRFVEFGTKRGMFVVGHTLLWHSQTPAWVFQNDKGGDASREELLARLREHIRTVVGRYRGKIKGWDVVNESIHDDGTLRTNEPWYRILGEEAVFEAFRAAHEADPDAELYYNDYTLANPVKRAGVLALVKKIRARGLRIDGVGSQEHHLLEWPTVEQVDAMFRDFGAAGFPMMVTELDVSALPRPNNDDGANIATLYTRTEELDPYARGLPEEMQRRLAERYRSLFEVYVRHAGNLKRVTFWCVTDGNSWLNNFPIRGRTDYPLLFDRQYRPKLAAQAVVDALQARR
ncbi:endo-1,4-beta-xylanase [Nibricoccus sp. IMCC34717]|uniref:endo-1,4-beta-xylanase n=1 Tax=Nibricoccus sp. IMCC34717 TaxID=3034021 RepID=UPI00384C8284